MPVRATKRGAARTPFAAGADADVLVCGASFAGLAVARELRSAGVRARWPLPWTFSTFDYRTLCGLLFEQGTASFDIAKVNSRTGAVVHTDRGDVSAPLIVDALGWRRVLGVGENVQPPEATLSRGLEVHPSGAGA